MTEPAPGTTANIIAALCSLFIPGLGQLVQGRILWALVWFVLGGILWLITFTTGGWIANLLSAIHAALYRGRR